MTTHPELPITALGYAMVLFLLLVPHFTLKGIPSWNIKYMVTLVIWHVWFNLRENRGGKEALSKDKLWCVITGGLDPVEFCVEFW